MAEENNQAENKTQDQATETTASATVDESSTGSSTGKDAQDSIKASVTERNLASVDDSAKNAAGGSSQSETLNAARSDEASRTTVTESSDSSDAVFREIGLSRFKRPFNEKTASTLNRAGLIFMAVSGAILITLTYILYKISTTGAIAAMARFENDRDLLNHYLYIFSGPLLLFLASLMAASIGYALMRAAGTATKQVVNPEDMDLVALLLANNKQSFIDDFVRLSSLAGFTGMFTKVGLYGLPLATIVLTIIFTVLAMIMTANQQSLFDLAKLTLGAFIGSYVQRQSVETQAQDIRRQVTDVQNKMVDVQSKITDVQKKV